MKRLTLMLAVCLLLPYGCNSDLPVSPNEIPLMHSYNEALMYAIEHGLECAPYFPDWPSLNSKQACARDAGPRPVGNAKRWGWHKTTIGDVDAPRSGNPWDFVWNCDVETEIVCWFEWNDTHTFVREVCDFGACSPDFGFE